MENFKKSFFGGYQKSEVDNALDTLNKKISDLEATNKKLQLKSETDAVKITRLENALGEYSAENERLKAEVRESSPVFKNIAKIYERAYGVGADIVSHSKNAANEMLSGIDESVLSIINGTADVVSECETLHRDFEETLKALGDSLNKVSQNADSMLEKAHFFNNLNKKLEGVSDKAKLENEKIFANYESTASEFMSTDSKSTEEEHSTVTLPQESEEQKFEPLQEEKPETVHNEEVETVAEEPQIAQEEEIETAIEETAEDVKTEDIESTEVLETETAQTISFEEVKEKESETEESEPTPILPLPVHQETVVEEETVIEEYKKERVTPKETARTSVEAIENQEFTQFGRKSQLSAQDRSELLRKALLKSGSN